MFLDSLANDAYCREKMQRTNLVQRLSPLVSSLSAGPYSCFAVGALVKLVGHKELHFNETASEQVAKMVHDMLTSAVQQQPLFVLTGFHIQPELYTTSVGVSLLGVADSNKRSMVDANLLTPIMSGLLNPIKEGEESRTFLLRALWQLAFVATARPKILANEALVAKLKEWRGAEVEDQSPQEFSVCAQKVMATTTLIPPLSRMIAEYSIHPLDYLFAPDIKDSFEMSDRNNEEDEKLRVFTPVRRNSITTTFHFDLSAI